MGTPGASQPLNELQVLPGFRMCLAFYNGYMWDEAGMGPGLQFGGSGRYGTAYGCNTTRRQQPGGRIVQALIVYHPERRGNQYAFASIVGQAPGTSGDRAQLRFHSGPWHSLLNCPPSGSDGIDLAA